MRRNESVGFHTSSHWFYCSKAWFIFGHGLRSDSSQVLTKFRLIEHDVLILHDIGMRYSKQGLPVPEQILQEPRSQILIEMKRLESRLILELCLLTIAGLIPPLALLIA